MRAHVFVTLKKTVLDPQGATILGALKNLGTETVTEVRQGKFFELGLADHLTREAAQAEVERLARDVFTNPVIEEFRYEILE